MERIVLKKRSRQQRSKKIDARTHTHARTHAHTTQHNTHTCTTRAQSWQTLSPSSTSPSPRRSTRLRKTNGTSLQTERQEGAGGTVHEGLIQTHTHMHAHIHHTRFARHARPGVDDAVARLCELDDKREVGKVVEVRVNAILCGLMARAP